MVFPLLCLCIFAVPIFAAPVHEAARAGDVITVAALIDSDPALSLDLPGPGRNTPLIEAAKADKLDVVRFLMIRRAQVNLTNTEGRSALSYAVERGNLQMVELLLQNAADPNVRDNKGYTPLITAAFAGRLDIVSTLVERGANVLLRDYRGILPATYAVNYPEIVDYLKSKGLSLENKYR